MSPPAIRSQSTCRKRSPPSPQGEDIALDIVYEDDDIIVIDKPKGLVVHPAAGHETGTLVNALIAHCGASLSGIGGVRRPGIVHRLDKDTTGLMVAAKNDRAHQSLTAQFADHGRTGAMRRGYLAFAWGVPNRQRGTVDAPIDRHPHAREKMAVREGGRDAITHWEIAGSLQRPRRQTGRGPAGLPARDRPHPSDPGASRPYRPSSAGRCRLWPALQDQGQPPRRPRARRPWPPSAAKRYMHTSWRWNTPKPGRFWSGFRICPPTWPLLRECLRAAQ